MRRTKEGSSLESKQGREEKFEGKEIGVLAIIRDFELAYRDIVNYAWSEPGRTGFLVSFVPMHTMHMSNDRWTCQFHWDPVSMRAIFIG